MKISDQLRDAIRSSGVSITELAARAEMNHSGLSRFVAGEGLSLATVDRVARVLGLRLVETVGRRKTVRARRAARGNPAASVPPASASDPEAPGVWSDELARELVQ